MPSCGGVAEFAGKEEQMTNFRQLLKEKDLHGAQLARRIGVSVQLVHYWMREGSGLPKAVYLDKIANALGVSIETVVKCFVAKEDQ